jgi:hypothetical protein
MGFLNWLQGEDDSEASQLNLDGSSQPLTPHERVDGATVFKDFTKSIKGVGGSNRAISGAVEAETQELFNCSTEDLYKQTGGKKGNRSTLPSEAQKAYMASEIRATHELGRTEFYDCENPDQVDRKIVSTTRAAAKETRKWLPW